MIIILKVQHKLVDMLSYIQTSIMQSCVSTPQHITLNWYAHVLFLKNFKREWLIKFIKGLLKLLINKA